MRLEPVLVFSRGMLRTRRLFLSLNQPSPLRNRLYYMRIRITYGPDALHRVHTHRALVRVVAFWIAVQPVVAAITCSHPQRT